MNPQKEVLWGLWVICSPLESGVLLIRGFCKMFLFRAAFSEPLHTLGAPFRVL